MVQGIASQCPPGGLDHQLGRARQVSRWSPTCSHQPQGYRSSHMAVGSSWCAGNQHPHTLHHATHTTVVLHAAVTQPNDVPSSGHGSWLGCNSNNMRAQLQRVSRHTALPVPPSLTPAATSPASSTASLVSVPLLKPSPLPTHTGETHTRCECCPSTARAAQPHNAALLDHKLVPEKEPAQPPLESIGHHSVTRALDWIWAGDAGDCGGCLPAGAGSP